MCAVWTLVRKQTIQYLGVISHKNSLLLVLKCLLSPHQCSSKEPSCRQQGHRPWLWNVCSLEAVPSNFISLEITAFVLLTKQMHIHTANISRQCFHLASVGYAYWVHYNYDLPFVWNETGVHSWTKVYLLFKCESRDSSCKNIETRVHNTHYEGIILQKRFVKKSNWNFRNLGKNIIKFSVKLFSI
jgi:hypothetical protein